MADAAAIAPVIPSGRREKELRMSSSGAEFLLDARNLTLLRLMREDPRITISELARRGGRAAPARRGRARGLGEGGGVPGEPARRGAPARGCAPPPPRAR